MYSIQELTADYKRRSGWVKGPKIGVSIQLLPCGHQVNLSLPGRIKNTCPKGCAIDEKAFTEGD